MLLWFRQFFHPGGSGYWFWSGIGSDLGELTLLTAVILWYRQHECHVIACHRPAFHPHPEHGHPVCRRHHPDADANLLERSRHE